MIPDSNEVKSSKYLTDLLYITHFPALSRAIAAVSGVPFSMYIILALSMY